MKDPTFLIFHLLTTLAKLLRPGGSRTITAENLLLKQQLLIQFVERLIGSIRRELLDHTSFGL